MGTAALPIEKQFVPPAALPSWPSSAVSDGGFAKGTIDLGGLEVRQITTFTKVWYTTQGGQDGVGATFFKPSPVPAGVSVLGHYAQPNNRPLFGHVLVARDTSGTGAILAAPVDYTLVWSSPDGAGHFWLPNAPEGYKAIGAVVTATSDKPSPDEVRCVRTDFTDGCETEESVLSSDKDGFSAATLRPSVRGIDGHGVHAGTFVAQSSATPGPGASTLACLKNNAASHTSSMPDLAQVNSLLAAYAPHVYLHPDEPYLPSSVTWFFENGALLYQKGNQTPTPHSAGTWVEASQLEYLVDGDGGNSRPVAYASLHGHAMYPKAGLVLQGDGTLGVGIRNDTAKGSRLDAGRRCEVVSAEYLGVAEPAWLGFEREWGPREEYDIGREINRVARILPRSVRERLAKLVEKVLVGEGPAGPKMHGNWRNDEREA
ncbi:hypothetical protein HU200_051710 [Digitaria exilis]|uniref:Uncharacterized protein n=1 Tax=Digitaria exilis TaxID=1010633 RepID=A0A835AQE8_9POAL|nr:hypothetical protein HU200_051710 [Digitaria exilis]